MNLSDRIRDEIRDEIGPCPTCAHPRMTVAALAAVLGQPPSTVGRFLTGGKPPVALLDSADSYLQERARAVVAPLLAKLEQDDGTA